MNITGSRVVASVMLGVFTLGVVTSFADEPTTFEAIGPIDFEVTDMSADGSVIVGKYIFGSPAFRWTREDGTKFIGGNGGNISVSSDGLMISGNALVDSHNEAAVWLDNDNWQPLGGLGTTGCPHFSNNYDISGDGQVVVGLGWNGCDASAFRWDQVTGMVDLGYLLANEASRANGVNYDGSVIVGWDDSGGGRVGARWVNYVESLLSDNSDPDLFVGEAQASTPDGSIIVGGGAAPIANNFYDQAYIWTESSGAKLIGKLPGGGNSRAFAYVVSDDGTQVGGFSGAQFREAFLWNAETGIVNFVDYLEALGVSEAAGWNLGNMRAMSADGTKMAGWGINPDLLIQGWLVENLPPLGDVDSDTVFDALDNCSEEENTDQRDTNDDGFGNLCDPDLNNDLVVNFLDIALFSTVFLTADEDADFNGDGAVNFLDLAVLQQYFLAPPGPSGLAP